MSVEIVRPHARFRESFLRALRAYQVEGLAWYDELDAELVARDFEVYVQQRLAKVSLRTQILVPETELWAVVDGQYAGQISIRHELTEALRSVGGHIGYDTAPDFRRQGVASAMLAAALPVARDQGLAEVLLTCNDSNAASIKVIEKNGGVLRDKRMLAPGQVLKRYYWIKL